VNTDGSSDLDALARDMARTWPLAGNPARVDVGVNKVTWRVGDFWLSSDFATAGESVARLERLLDRVATEFGRGIAVPQFVPSPRGPVVEEGGRVWWVTCNIPGRHPIPSAEPDMLAVAGGLARMHDALRRIPPEYAVSGDTCEGLFKSGERLVSDRRLKFTGDDLDVARQAAAAVTASLPAVLGREMQITHGDPSNPNLFVADSPLRLVGAIDWDYARFDLVISDVATMAQTILFRSGTNRPRQFLEAALAAYTAAGGILLGFNETLIGVLMVLFEAIAHHGNRYIQGQGGYEHVGGRIENMRKVLRLMH
jgi:aminoglycoside phosphotransferase (APT) family kinase protein